MEDIEDMEPYVNRAPVAAGQVYQLDVSPESEFSWQGHASGDSFIPGSLDVYMKTWGCAHNSSDSEYMAGLISEAGYGMTEDRISADVWILNSCTVKSPSEQHVVNAVEEGRQLGKIIIVCGCVPQADRTAAWLEGVSVVGVQHIDRIVEILEHAAQGATVRLLHTRYLDGRRAPGPALALPKMRRNPLVEILPISTGCLNHCTYCKTKLARGNLTSYPMEDILERVEAAFAEGVKELWLTSEDLGAYGRDIGLTLPDLLNRLVRLIPEGCMLRLGMTNPPYILDYLEEMAAILRHPNVYKFLHIPVQAGSDSVLREMRREYTIDEFRAVVDYMLQNVPGITIATDVICGFPTESEADFEETLHLIDQYRFASVFINQFYPRPGTKAAKMIKLPTVVVKARTRRLTELFNSYEPYADRVGQRYVVLVTENASYGDLLVGHNEAYEQILVPNRPGLMGSRVQVEIVSTRRHCMFAKEVEPNPLFRYVGLRLSMREFMNVHLFRFVIFTLLFVQGLRMYFSYRWD